MRTFHHANTEDFSIYHWNEESVTLAGILPHLDAHHLLLETRQNNQGCGSGSGRIRNYLHVRIRIRNLISDSDPDPDPSAVVFQHTVW